MYMYMYMYMYMLFPNDVFRPLSTVSSSDDIFHKGNSKSK